MSEKKTTKKKAAPKSAEPDKLREVLDVCAEYFPKAAWGARWTQEARDAWAKIQAIAGK